MTPWMRDSDPHGNMTHLPANHMTLKQWSTFHTLPESWCSLFVHLLWLVVRGNGFQAAGCVPYPTHSCPLPHVPADHLGPADQNTSPLTQGSHHESLHSAEVARWQWNSGTLRWPWVKPECLCKGSISSGHQLPPSRRLASTRWWTWPRLLSDACNQPFARDPLRAQTGQFPAFTQQLASARGSEKLRYTTHQSNSTATFYSSSKQEATLRTNQIAPPNSTLPLSERQRSKHFLFLLLTNTRNTAFKNVITANVN